MRPIEHLRGLTLAFLLGNVLLGGTALGATSAPPAKVEAGKLDTKKASLLLPPDAPAQAVTLPAPSEGEKSAILAKRASTSGKVTTKRRAMIGFGRAVPADARTMRLADLTWTDVPGGGRAATVRVQSPGASALRIELALHDAPQGLTMRFAGSANATVFGPYAGSLAERSPYWSPVLEGDTGTIELALPAGVDAGTATLSMPRVSHLLASGAALKQADPLDELGAAGSCEVDVVCMDPTLQRQASAAINATARLVVTVGADTFLCSGTLVNDSISSGTPYLLTANHCFDDADSAAARGDPAAAAASLNTYWFFQTTQCGVAKASAVNFTVLAGGARLLGRSVDWDWNLLVLNESPPAGATFAPWNAAAPVAAGTAGIGIHHPEGDLKKLSQGTVTGLTSYSDGSTFTSVIWSQGVTEPGSSGSGLFTYSPGHDWYELRGMLFGGDSACTVRGRSGVDQYSRLDVMLPLVKQYLTPDAANTAQKVVVVEFYNAQLDDYFMTANPQEIDALDTGVLSGWVRTGLTFLAYANPALAPPGAQPVCRFYVLPAVGDSHFYSGDPAECQQTAVRFAGTWVEESPALFYIQIPDRVSGVCPPNTRPIFRFVNDANGLHHRYTAEVDVRDATNGDGGWTQEGYGALPGGAVMCSPTV